MCTVVGGSFDDGDVIDRTMLLKNNNILLKIFTNVGHPVTQLVEELHYMSEGRGFGS
jgi:hypothetical protein